jgi:hypothetical protein
MLQNTAGNRATVEVLSRISRGGSMPRVRVQREHDSADSDDSDHGEDNLDLDRGTSYIDWSELTAQALKRRSDNTLFAVFYNLVQYWYLKERVQLPAWQLFQEPYVKWKKGGVYTRARFKELVGLGRTVLETDAETPNIIQRKLLVQRARTGNTYSINGPYTGTSANFAYDNVIYYRDSKGNVEFDKDPGVVVGT